MPPRLKIRKIVDYDAKSKTSFKFTWTIQNFKETFEDNFPLKSPMFTSIGCCSKLYIMLSLVQKTYYVSDDDDDSYYHSNNSNGDESDFILSVENLSPYFDYCKRNNVKSTVTIKIENGGHVLSTHIIGKEPIYIKENEISQKMKDTSLTLSCEIAENIDENMDLDSTIGRQLKEFDDFGQLLYDEEHSDVTLVVGEDRLPAHKCILSKKSPVFAAMFRHKMSENENNLVNIDDFNVNVIKELLTFVYKGKIGDIECLDSELYQAADKYHIEGLKVVCVDVMCQNITTNNVYDYFDFARLYKINKLKNASIKFIASHENDLLSAQLP